MFPINGGVPSTPTYVDDVFSTYLYASNGSTQTINNGIDLANKGGMVWSKSRNSGASFNQNYVWDTVRGGSSTLCTDTAAAALSSAQVTFTSTGYNMTASSYPNVLTGDAFVSWTFRKAPKFFDIVTWSGDNTTRNISHSLGIAPGMIIVKRTDSASTQGWVVWHTSIGGALNLLLNGTAAAAALVNGSISAATSTNFTVQAGSTNIADVNATGGTYIAYLFAHDTASDGMIKCGSFSSYTSNTVTLGWEPQFILYKSDQSGGNWKIIDVARNYAGNVATAVLSSNTTGSESTTSTIGYPTATGFYVVGTGSTGVNYYLAIRRPNKPPTSGTQVFQVNNSTSGGPDWIGGANGYRPEFCDLAILAGREGYTKNFTFADRLRGFQNSFSSITDTSTTPSLITSSTNAESVTGGAIYQLSNSTITGVVYGTSGYGTNRLSYSLRRAPGVFDIVCYKGTSPSINTVAHNLKVVPELIIIKNRTSNLANWPTYTGDPLTYMYLNSMGGPSSMEPVWANTTPTATNFYVGNDPNASFNASTHNYVAYLFASKAGISKVGTYTGNQSTQTINCGFTTGARFIMIRRTDSNAGNWYIWDSIRGIIAGNDPFFSLESTSAELTAYDVVDPDPTGFIVNVGVGGINDLGVPYFYLAFA